MLVVAAYELAEDVGETVPLSAIEEVAEPLYAMLTALVR